MQRVVKVASVLTTTGRKKIQTILFILIICAFVRFPYVT